MNNPIPNSPHTIRLHGPWSAEVIETWAGDIVASQSFKCQIPCDWEPWLGVDFRGRVKLLRPFGFPTGLDPDQTIDLVIDGVDYCATATLNGHQLGPVQFLQSARHSIRRLLLPRNRLELIIDLPLDVERGERQHLAGGLIGSVRLEIGLS